MTITTRPERIAANCKQPPFSDEQMGQMWRNGDSMSVIANLAKRRNGLWQTPQMRCEGSPRARRSSCRLHSQQSSAGG